MGDRDFPYYSVFFTRTTPVSTTFFWGGTWQRKCDTRMSIGVYFLGWLPPTTLFGYIASASAVLDCL